MSKQKTAYVWIGESDKGVFGWNIGFDKHCNKPIFGCVQGYAQKKGAAAAFKKTMEKLGITNWENAILEEEE